MRVTVLGCNGGITGGRRTTCYLVDDDMLIDAGTGAGELTLEQAIRIDTVFLTHAHLDHTALLPMLADAEGAFRKSPLTVYALPETIASLMRHMLNGELWPDYTALPSPEQPYLRFAPLHAGDTIELGGRRITALPAKHSIPCVGYRIDNGDASLVYSADTTYCEEFWQTLGAMDNLRYLLIENTFLNANSAGAERSGHMTAALLAQGLAQLPRPVELCIVHMEPGREEKTMREVMEAAGEFKPRVLRCGDVLEV